jgi:hypothetical protein
MAYSNLIEDQIIKSIEGFVCLGYHPKKIILLPNPVTKNINMFMGLEVEHRVLYSSDGEIIPIAFEE